MKKQVILIHGGDSFDSYEKYLKNLKTRPIDVERLRPRVGWKNTIQKDLGSEFDVLQPEMPNRSNANFKEWRIWFERMKPFCKKK